MWMEDEGQAGSCTIYACSGTSEWNLFQTSSNSYLVIKGLYHNVDICILPLTRGLWDSVLYFIHSSEGKSNIINIHLMLRNYYVEPNTKSPWVRYKAADAGLQSHALLLTCCHCCPLCRMGCLLSGERISVCGSLNRAK